MNHIHHRNVRQIMSHHKENDDFIVFLMAVLLVQPSKLNLNSLKNK